LDTLLLRPGLTSAWSLTAPNRRSRISDKRSYIQTFRADVEALATAAHLGLEAPVPSCPGWIVTNIVIHLGTVYRGWTHVLRAAGAEWPLDIRKRVLEQTFPELVGLFERGEQGMTAWTIPNGLIEWFGQGAAEVEAALRHADLDEWFWQPPEWPSLGDQRLGLFLRAANIETAVHRWDAQLAHERTAPIDRAVAELGIEQALREMIPMNRWYVREYRKAPARQGSGEIYRFQQTDGDGTWIVRFQGDSTIVEGRPGRADVVIHGSASDLLLFLWHRIPAERVKATGDTTLLDRYFDLVPPL